MNGDIRELCAMSKVNFKPTHVGPFYVAAQAPDRQTWYRVTISNQ